MLNENGRTFKLDNKCLRAGHYLSKRSLERTSDSVFVILYE